MSVQWNSLLKTCFLVSMFLLCFLMGDLAWCEVFQCRSYYLGPSQIYILGPGLSPWTPALSIQWPALYLNLGVQRQVMLTLASAWLPITAPAPELHSSHHVAISGHRFSICQLPRPKALESALTLSLPTLDLLFLASSSKYMQRTSLVV